MLARLRVRPIQRPEPLGEVALLARTLRGVNLCALPGSAINLHLHCQVGVTLRRAVLFAQDRNDDTCQTTHHQRRDKRLFEGERKPHQHARQKREANAWQAN